MKILIDARMYGLENAGIGRYIINLIEELKNLKTGDEFVILLRKNYFDSLKFPSNWKKLLADFRHYTFAEQMQLPNLINKEKPDIVHFPHINTPLFFSGKYVVTIHDLTMHKQKTDATTLPLPTYYLKRIPYLVNSYFTVKKAAKIIVPATAVKSEITNFYKNINSSKLKIIYEGFTENKTKKEKNIKKILKKYNLSKPYFIYVGNAYPHKNLSKAIKATVYLNNKLSGKNKKIIFAIGGSRSVFTDKLTSMIKSESAEDFVKLIGFVDDNDLPILFKESEGFLYPSLAEGYGLQGIESMASGTLVLASDIPVFKEVYDRCALFFNPKESKSIAEVMQYALNMTGYEREKLIEKSQKFIKKYSWKKMAEETMEVYKSVL